MEGYVKGIKQKIKKIIGLRNIIVIKRFLCYLKGILLIFEKEKIKLNENYIDGITELSQKGRNVFCGYYDVPIFDKKCFQDKKMQWRPRRRRALGRGASAYEIIVVLVL